jgi:hypothetical protein
MRESLPGMDADVGCSVAAAELKLTLDAEVNLTQ